ncbi:LURP-one-related family protein [Leucobacter allii]|uniref:LURP-one-related/scramblase family protein n=1 Tax=Leucobacter allii TaxID=2932247 RepID=UPI001FD53500|nr:LURP-one-related family protein [Leucobacter allii]UOR03123.1 LURP-one-related family protein [Leucobacter allii]
MRYQMTRKLFALGDQGVITDEHGNPVYRNAGKFFSLHDRVRLLDMQGEEVATFHSKLLSFPKRMFIEIGGEPAATVTRKALAVRVKFDIELASGERWELHGDWVDRSFTLTDGAGATVAQVTKAWVSVAGRYGIDIAEGRDELLVLMILVALESSVAEDEENLDVGAGSTW